MPYSFLLKDSYRNHQTEIGEGFLPRLFKRIDFHKEHWFPLQNKEKEKFWVSCLEPKDLKLVFTQTTVQYPIKLVRDKECDSSCSRTHIGSPRRSTVKITSSSIFSHIDRMRTFLCFFVERLRLTSWCFCCFIYN